MKHMLVWKKMKPKIKIRVPSIRKDRQQNNSLVSINRGSRSISGKVVHDKIIDPIKHEDRGRECELTCDHKSIFSA